MYEPDYRPRRRYRSELAAEYMGISGSYLAHLRMRGKGPPYARLGKIILYDQTDLDAYVDQHRQDQTSDLKQEVA